MISPRYALLFVYDMAPLLTRFGCFREVSGRQKLEIRGISPVADVCIISFLIRVIMPSGYVADDHLNTEIFLEKHNQVQGASKVACEDVEEDQGLFES